MNNFSYKNCTEIVFGRGTEAEAGARMAQLGKKVLLVYGGGSIKKSGLYDRITASLNEAGLSWTELSGVMPNPRLSLVYEGIEKCRREGVDCILAVGGGSVMDTAKTIGIGAIYGGDVWELFDKGMVDVPMLPLGVVVTIPASGSESSHAAIITRDEGNLKRALASQNARPAFAILNPELTYTLPPFQTACGIADMLCHVMERYLCMEGRSEVTDRTGEGLMRAIINLAPVVMREPNNYDARADLMWAGTIAHNDFFGVGRDQDWAAHNIEHEVSAEYEMAHGAGLAIVFPAWCRFIQKERRWRFVQFAVRVWDVDLWYGDEDAIIEEGISRLQRFFESLGLKTSFTAAGIGDEKFDKMASTDSPIGFYRHLSKEDILEVLRLAL
ncbi:MAG: iron-containing alcohol dehydrogenase [Oscillospiraceae bacterium]|jgi:alcohol dehydrogenase YqhD (iron-dependent ADH family)